MATLQHQTEYSFKQELHAVNNIIRIFAWKFNYVIARIHFFFFVQYKHLLKPIEIVCRSQFTEADSGTFCGQHRNTKNGVLCPAGCIEFCATLSNKIRHGLLSNQIQGKYDHTLCTL